MGCRPSCYPHCAQGKSLEETQHGGWLGSLDLGVEGSGREKFQCEVG